MKLKDLLVEGTPSTVISGIMSSELDKAISLLKKAGFKASVYQDEYVGVSGDNSEAAKDKMYKTLKGKLNDNHFEISESLMVEADMRTMFNAVYDAALKGDKDVLKAIDMRGRLSDQNVEDAMDNVSDKQIKEIYNKYIK